MEAAAQNEGQEPLADRAIAVSAAFEGSAEIAEARDMARDLLASVQAEQGLPVSARAMGMVQLVVSELVTNARKYASARASWIWRSARVPCRSASGTATPPCRRCWQPTRNGSAGTAWRSSWRCPRASASTGNPVGKRITASVVLADDPGGDAAGRQALSGAAGGRGWGRRDRDRRPGRAAAARLRSSDQPSSLPAFQPPQTTGEGWVAGPAVLTVPSNSEASEVS
jgi:hypothetical protein